MATTKEQTVTLTASAYDRLLEAAKRAKAATVVYGKRALAWSKQEARNPTTGVGVVPFVVGVISAIVYRSSWVRNHEWTKKYWWLPYVAIVAVAWFVRRWAVKRNRRAVAAYCEYAIAAAAAAFYAEYDARNETAPSKTEGAEEEAGAPSEVYVMTANGLRPVRGAKYTMSPDGLRRILPEQTAANDDAAREAQALYSRAA